MTLYELMKFINQETDKYNLGYFDEFYENMFNKIKDPINLLEIGIYNGASIKLWREYFHKSSKIFGMDINYCSNISSSEGIEQIIGNAYTDNLANRFNNDYLDIIIDDGPHTLESFIKLIDLYYNKLKTDGILIIEDIIDLNWTPLLIEQSKNKGFKKIIKYEMAKKQKTPELYEIWKNGLDVLVLQK